MKFSWGKGIFVVYGLFITGVIIMVSISISRNVDLVVGDYYDKEIRYQEEIDRINNTSELKVQVGFELIESNLIISFPANSPRSQIQGEIYFYRPSDSKKDFRVDIQPGSDFRQKIDLENAVSGLWKVKINWSMDGLNYLSTHNFLKP